MSMPPGTGPWTDPTGQPAPPSWPVPVAPAPAPLDPPTAPVYETPRPTYAVPGYGTPGYQARRPTNGLALAAMICSLVGFMNLVSWPVGAVLGHVALRQIRETGEGGEAYAKVGIIVGWIGTALLAVGCFGLIAVVISLNRQGF